MITQRAFQPTGATASIAIPITTATGVAIPGLPTGSSSVRVVNDATETTFIAFGATEALAIAAATVAAGMPMVAGTVETFQVKNDVLYIAAVSVGGDGTLYVTSGEGA